MTVAPRAKTATPCLNRDVILLYQHQTKHKMKTTTIILATLLALTSNILVAGNDSYNTEPVLKAHSSAIAPLAPVVPSEATFEDAPSVADLSGLVPAMPSEAGFEDAVMKGISLSGLYPVLPAEAYFE